MERGQSNGRAWSPGNTSALIAPRFKHVLVMRRLPFALALGPNDEGASLKMMEYRAVFLMRKELFECQSSSQVTLLCHTKDPCFG